jgi:hypothetical protein
VQDYEKHNELVQMVMFRFISVPIGVWVKLVRPKEWTPTYLFI